MTTRQKIQLRLSEVRQRLNEISGLEGDAFTDEVRAEADRLQTEFRDLEVRQRSALIAEGEAEQRAAEQFQDGDGEQRELAALHGRVRVGNYFGAAIEQRSVGGAEAELNQALHMGGNQFPMQLLAPPAQPQRETRATSDTDIATAPQPWLDRLLAESAAMRLGISARAVAPGSASFPVTTAGTTGAQRGKTEAAADTAWTVGVEELKPTRNAVHLSFSIEDAARLPMLESALRRDLQAGLMEAVDRAVFLGDTGATGTDADIVGLTTATGVVEKTITQTNKVKGPETLLQLVELVDGVHSTGVEDLRVVAAVGANTLWCTTIINSAADNMTLKQFLMAAGLSWTVRGNVETATANNDWAAFVGRGRGLNGAGVVALWGAGDLVYDPYSKAKEGQKLLTLNYLWNFGLPRPSNFARVKFVT